MTRSTAKSNGPQEVSAGRSVRRSRKLPAVLRHYKALRAIEKAWQEGEEILSPLDWEVVLEMLDNGKRSEQMMTPQFKELLMDYEAKGIQEAGDILLALDQDPSLIVSELPQSPAISGARSARAISPAQEAQVDPNRQGLKELYLLKAAHNGYTQYARTASSKVLRVMSGGIAKGLQSIINIRQSDARRQPGTSSARRMPAAIQAGGAA